MCILPFLSIYFANTILVYSDPLNTIPLSNQCPVQALNNIVQNPLSASQTPKIWTEFADKIVTMIKDISGAEPPCEFWKKDAEYPNDFTDLSYDDGTTGTYHSTWQWPFIYVMTQKLGLNVHPPQTVLDTKPCKTTPGWYTAYKDDRDPNITKHTQYGPGAGTAVLTDTQLVQFHENVVNPLKGIKFTVNYYRGNDWLHVTSAVKIGTNYWYLDNNAHGHCSLVPDTKGVQRLFKKEFPYQITTHLFGTCKVSWEPTDKTNVKKHIMRGMWRKAKRGKFPINIEYSHKIGEINNLREWIKQKLSVPEVMANKFQVITGNGGLTEREILEKFCKYCNPPDPGDETKRETACNNYIDKLLSGHTINIPIVPSSYYYNYYNYFIFTESIIMFSILIILLFFICISCGIIGAICGFFMNRYLSKKDIGDICQKYQV